MSAVTITANIPSIRDLFDRIASRIEESIDGADFADALDFVIQELESVTPVRSGQMLAGYTIATGRGYAELLDTAESPGGYPYPGRVVFQPNFSSAYDALQQVLERAELDLTSSLNARITTGVNAP